MQNKNKSSMAHLYARLQKRYKQARKWSLPLFRKAHHYITPQRLLVAGGASLALLCLVYITWFMWPQKVILSYDTDTCITQPTLLPRLVTPDNNPAFGISQKPGLKFGNYPVYSHTTCVTPTHAPQSNHQDALRLHVNGLRFINKKIIVQSPARPNIQPSFATDTPLSTTTPLAFTLNTVDKIFSYQIVANGKASPCLQAAKTLRCNTTPLALAQSTRYAFKLERVFDGKAIETLYNKEHVTVEAVRVVGSSITVGQIVHDKPESLQLTLNKPATRLKDPRLKMVTAEGSKVIDATFTIQDKAIIAKWKEALPRAAQLSLSIEGITAADSGFLAEPYILPFQTSGGPKVLGVSIGSYRVQPSGNITVRFDTPALANQVLANFVRIEIDGKPIPAHISASGRNITLTPQATMPRCAAFTVRVLDGLQNEFGVSGGSAWSFKSRTLCQTVFSIGTSANGRAITAYKFGTGSSKIIYVGGTHGNERSSVYIMNRWVDYLESNAHRLPGHRSIIVIPNLNPDGYAANSRVNANNVDLNRNFPASNWKSGVTMPDKSYWENGGGTSPLSEPESRALANYVRSESPRLVLTYHASGGVVVPNGSGDSHSIAVTYGRQSSVGFMDAGATGSFFKYDTTGAFEDWLHEKHGIPTLLIELLTKTNQEFNGHRNALWTTATLP